ncbi:MAG: heme-binding protein [Deltaproteobacteria bacterium]|nr:heme-binding protein [Deltaproteobacteria bacterium]
MANKVKSHQMPNPYGLNINLATAKKIAWAAAKEANRIKINAIIAIVDAGGHLIYLERFDKAQFGSIDVAVHKARCSVAYKRPTKAFEDAVNTGKISLLTLDGICTVEGGLPIIQSGKIVGAIGVSGGTSQEDGQIAASGVRALK